MVFQCCLFIFIPLISCELEYHTDFLTGGRELDQINWGQSIPGRTRRRPASALLPGQSRRPRRHFPDFHSCVGCSNHTWEASNLFHGVEGAIAQISQGSTDSREFRQETRVQIWGQGTWKWRRAPGRKRSAGRPGQGVRLAAPLLCLRWRAPGATPVRLDWAGQTQHSLHAGADLNKVPRSALCISTKCCAQPSASRRLNKVLVTTERKQDDGINFKLEDDIFKCPLCPPDLPGRDHLLLHGWKFWRFPERHFGN